MNMAGTSQAHALCCVNLWLASSTSHPCLSHPPTNRRPSGSGKTTLLDLLAGRKTVGKLDGSIAFAGNKPTPQFLRRFTGGHR